MNLKITWSTLGGGPLATCVAEDGIDAAIQLIAMIQDAGGELSEGDRFEIAQTDEPLASEEA